jgi:hypothetical protein
VQLYTLTSSFIPRDIVTDFVSAIWTERYSAAGDVQIVAPATPDMIDLLSQGTFLGLRGVKEIMILDTQSIEDGLLTVTGQSLPKFLDERMGWFKDTDVETEALVGDFVATTTAGQLIANAVDKTVINPAPFGLGFASVDLDWAREKIQGLELGLVDANGTPRRITLSKGPLYTSINQLATAEGVGFKLYLKSASRSAGYVLRFATYRGKNRTSEQSVHQMVRLTPQMDSLTDVKEVGSISTYKNVIYVKYMNAISRHYAEPTLPIPEGFNRRVLLVEAEDIYLVPDRITEYREQTARDAIANHVYVKAVDGQTSPQNNYQFNVDYGLGDVIELEGFTGLMSKARVTEYIRSQDQFGDKEYPTLSVIDPLNTGFMPDLEPDDDWEDDWNEDPEFDLDDDFDDWDDEDLEDLDANRRKRRKRPDPKPTAPDPDLNPVPEDPNPDPEPEFADRGEGGGVYDYSKVFEWENAGYRPMESPEGYPAGARFECHFEDTSQEDAWDYTLHISGETRIRVNRPHPTLPDPAAVGGTIPGHFGALEGPLMSFAIYETIFTAAAMNPLYEIVIPVNDARAVRSFTGDLGGEIHMDWSISFAVPGKLSFPEFNVVAHHFWVSGISDVSHLMPSHVGWVAGPTPLEWETPKLYAVYSWKSREEE